jgi:hypothetical protein
MQQRRISGSSTVSSQAVKRGVPPPPPPPPVRKVGMDLQSSIKAGITLKRAPEPPPKKVDVRVNILSAIKSGSAQLKTVSAQVTLSPKPASQVPEYLHTLIVLS